jgi:hypothetical protein
MRKVSNPARGGYSRRSCPQYPQSKLDIYLDLEGYNSCILALDLVSLSKGLMLNIPRLEGTSGGSKVEYLKYPTRLGTFSAAFFYPP